MLSLLQKERKKGREGGREGGKKEVKKKLNIIYIINSKKIVILNFSMSNMKQQQQKRPSRTSYKVRQLIYLAYAENLSV